MADSAPSDAPLPGVVALAFALIVLAWPLGEAATRTLQAIAGADPRDSTCLKAPVPDYRAALSQPVKGLKVGIVRECFEAEGLDPQVKASVRAAADQLAGLGCELVDPSPDTQRQLQRYVDQLQRQRRLLEHHPQVGQGAGCGAAHVVAQDVDAAGIGRKQARQQLHQGGFARAVGAQQGDAFTGLDPAFGDSERQRGGQAGQPGPLRGTGLLKAVHIARAAGAAGAAQQLALVVAGDRGQVQRHQAFGRFGGPERTGQDVAAVDDQVRTAACHVGQHGVQCGQVAVDVGKGDDAHR